MSSDAKANTLPKWSYILLAVLLGPFGVGLDAACGSPI